MIVDRSILNREIQDVDVVIVGAGAAGLTLAEALSMQGSRVLLLEAGASRATRQGQQDYRGDIASGPFYHPAADMYRVRALGGTTRIWGGRCIPYDPIDFMRRDWVEESGWPIGYDDVAGYYGRAMQVAEAGELGDDPSIVLPGEQPELVPTLDGPVFKTTLERFSRPTNFWTRFERVVPRTTGVDILPNVSVVAIRLTADGRRVSHLDVVDASGNVHQLRAPRYVLATGGLEVARLLLASNDIKSAGIGNAGDALGRYYMSHLCARGGIAEFTPGNGRIMSGYDRDAEGIYVRRRLWLTERAQREHRLQNITFRTYVPDPGDPAHGSAILSAMFLAKSFVQREYAATFSEHPVNGRAHVRHGLNVARQPLQLARFAHMWMRDRVLAQRKLPSVALPAADHRFHLEFHAEQEPNPASRVSLSGARDRFGMPRLAIDWRPTRADIESVQRAHALLARELDRTGTGRLTFDPDRLATRIHQGGVVGGHHIGTTRMAATERTGVVDTQCRVHGVEDLYVASASVLPTSGQANPTLTVLALTLRLADHLGAVTARRNSSCDVRAA